MICLSAYMSGRKEIIRVCLIGYGDWGKRIADKLRKNPSYSLDLIVTGSNYIDGAQRSILCKDLIYKDLQDIDLIYICSAAQSHYLILDKILYLGKAIVCEKPFVRCKEDFDRLNKKFDLYNYPNLLMVNYIHLFNKSFLSFVDKIKRDEKNIAYSTFDVSGPVVRQDISTKIDYGSHSISMILTILRIIYVNLDGVRWNLYKDRGCFHSDILNGCFYWKTKQTKTCMVSYTTLSGDYRMWDDKIDKFDSLNNLFNNIILDYLPNKFNNMELTERIISILDK